MEGVDSPAGGTTGVGFPSSLGLTVAASPEMATRKAELQSYNVGKGLGYPRRQRRPSHKGPWTICPRVYGKAFFLRQCFFSVPHGAWP